MICPNCTGNLYDSAELARAHAELLDAGRSISVSCAYCGSVHVRKPERSSHRSQRERRGGADRYIEDDADPRDQVQGAYAPARRRRPARRDGVRRVTPLLGIGIFFLPYIFAWFTLQHGYSSLSRWLSFGWLVILVTSSTA